MDRATAATLYELYERALAALSQAEMLLLDGEPEPGREALLATHDDISIAIQLKLRLPLQRRYRDLQSVDLGYARFSEVRLP